VEWVEGETYVLGGNLSHCRLVHRKTHMIWPGLEPEVTAVGGRGRNAGATARAPPECVLLFVFFFL
jgi:hypothetical protein